MREDHEELKIDSVERLTCCYAHSEETPTFHRRIYWLISSPTNATGTGEGVGATGVATPDISPADCHAVRGAEGVEKTGGVAKLPPKRNVSKCDEESATGGDGAENSSCSRYSVYLLYWYKSANTDAAEAAAGTLQAELNTAQDMLQVLSLTCFAGTQVRILTQHVAEERRACCRAGGGACERARCSPTLSRTGELRMLTYADVC